MGYPCQISCEKKMAGRLKEDIENYDEGERVRRCRGLRSM